jgi:hypothetical protein
MCKKRNLFLLKFIFLPKVGVEVVETVSDKEQDKWGPVPPEEVNELFSILYN